MSKIMPEKAAILNDSCTPFSSNPISKTNASKYENNQKILFFKKTKS